MTLIKCNECGDEISSKADSCPKCGFPLKQVKIFNPNIDQSIKKGCFGCLVIILIFFLLAVIGVIFQPEPNTMQSKKTVKKPNSLAQSSSVPSDPLVQMAIAFEGNYSKAQIKERIDIAMKLYNVPLTNEYYSRAGSALVTLRKEVGPDEMDILSYMIRNYVPGVAIDFPAMAGASASFLAAGDK